MSTCRESNFISVVVYLQGSQEGLSVFLDDLVKTMDDSFSAWELICVNDACSEDVKRELDRFTAGHRSVGVSVVNLHSFHGIERAMRAGVDLAIGDFVCEVDYWGDGFSAQDILRAYRKALEGYDVVGCSVADSGRRDSRFFYRLFNSAADLPLDIRTESFRVLSRRLIHRIKNSSASIPYRKAAYASCGLPAAFIEVERVDSNSARGTRGYDKGNRRFRRDLAVDALILFTKTGYRIALGASLTMMAIALLGLIYSLVSYVNGVAVSGWTTTILFMAVSFFGLFGLMAIVIKYLQILVDLSFKKAEYEYSSIERP